MESEKQSATLERSVHQRLEIPPPPGKIIFMFMWVCAAASPSCCNFWTGESWCEHLQKARKAGRTNTVEANSGLLFKQMFMNIFCHTCRVLNVIWLDGHMSLKVEDWIYGRRDDLEDELPSWPLESEISCLALHKHRHITWAYCSLPPLGLRGTQILLREHIGILSRTICVLYYLFIHNCCFLCFSLLANIVEICQFFILLPITPLSPSQGLSSFTLLLSQPPWGAVRTFLGGASPAKPGVCEVLVIQ